MGLVIGFLGMFYLGCGVTFSTRHEGCTCRSWVRMYESLGAFQMSISN